MKLFWKIPFSITTILIESSRQDLSINRFLTSLHIFKTNHITIFPCFTFIPQTGLGLPKPKVSFYYDDFLPCNLLQCICFVIVSILFELSLSICLRTSQHLKELHFASGIFHAPAPFLVSRLNIAFLFFVFLSTFLGEL